MKIIYLSLFLASTIAVAENTYHIDCSTPSLNFSFEWQRETDELSISYESEQEMEIQLVNEDSGLKILVNGQMEELSCANPQRQTLQSGITLINNDSSGPAWLKRARENRRNRPKYKHCTFRDRILRFPTYCRY